MVRSSQAEFILWTLLAVVAVGAFEVMTALQPLTPANRLVQSRAYLKTHPLKELEPVQLSLSSSDSPEQSTGATAEDKTGKSTARKPASQARKAASASAMTAANEAVELTIPCQGPMKTSFPASVVQVRLIGSNCGRKEIDSIDIQNLTNKVSATVFTTPPRAFTTDYIALKSGTNHISITTAYKGAPTESRELVIEHDLKRRNSDPPGT